MKSIFKDNKGEVEIHVKAPTTGEPKKKIIITYPFKRNKNNFTKYYKITKKKELDNGLTHSLPSRKIIRCTESINKLKYFINVTDFSESYTKKCS